VTLSIAEDEAQAMQDAAKYARRVRRRLGLSQAEFSKCIDVSIDTIRNWEQGKRSPTGAAKALLKVLDKAPEAALKKPRLRRTRFKVHQAPTRGWGLGQGETVVCPLFPRYFSLTE